MFTNLNCRQYWVCDFTGTPNNYEIKVIIQLLLPTNAYTTLKAQQWKANER